MAESCYACGQRKPTLHCHHCDRHYCEACLSRHGVRERFANKQSDKEAKPHPVKLHPSVCEAVHGDYETIHSPQPS